MVSDSGLGQGKGGSGVPNRYREGCFSLTQRPLPPRYGVRTTMRKKRLGDVLRERGHISAEDLSKALDEQSRKVGLLGEGLLQRGIVSKKDLVAALEEITSTSHLRCLPSQGGAEAV